MVKALTAVWRQSRRGLDDQVISGQLKADADDVRKHGEVITIEAVHRVLDGPANISHRHSTQFFTLFTALTVPYLEL